VQMPEMDGLTATRKLRRLETEGKLVHFTRTPIPIIAMTAHAMKGDRDRCLDAGMNSYVSKPIRSQLLYDAIAEIFCEPDEDIGEKASSGSCKRAPTTERRSKSPATDTLVDWPEALANCAGDLELLKDVAAAFSQELPKHLDDLRNALENGIFTEAQRIAHLLKGACANLAASRPRDRAFQLEQQAEQGDRWKASELLEELRPLLMDLDAALRDLQNDAIRIPH
ncbi:MAG: response regulator, partial [Planctomycetaceae bacterium]|nr:response regulator [Planctomycetaceae bacterium]